MSQELTGFHKERKRSKKKEKFGRGGLWKLPQPWKFISGGLRQLFLDEFPRLLEKACAKTAPAFSQLHTGPAAINLSIHFLDGGRGTQL